MDGNTRPKKGLLHLIETEEEITEAITSDIQQEIENRKQELESNLLDLTDALRSSN